MISRRITISLFLMAFYLLAGPAYASDLEKEKRWADQVVDAILDGEAVWLNDGKTEFLGIYTENQAEKAIGGAIIMHGIGVHPNWADVILPLRTELTNHGWTTLSIQMPILPNEAEPKDYAPLMKEVPARINTAIAYLKQQGIDNIVLVAHSLGTSMTAYYLGNGGKGASAFVSVGMSISPNTPAEMDELVYLPRITIPVCDVYGSQDLIDVVDGAAERARALSSNKGFKQIKVDGANHFFQGKETELVDVVSTCLAKLNEGNK